MTSKGLLAAAVVIALALSPSITECLRTHRDGERHEVWITWAWFALVTILAVLFGEQLFQAS